MKRSLKKWVKVVLTILTILVSVFIYTKTNSWGSLIDESNLYELLTVLSWTWLCLGQFLVIAYIWNGND